MIIPCVPSAVLDIRNPCASALEDNTLGNGHIVGPGGFSTDGHSVPLGSGSVNRILDMSSSRCISAGNYGMGVGP